MFTISISFTRTMIKPEEVRGQVPTVALIRVEEEISTDLVFLHPVNFLVISTKTAVLHLELITEEK